MTFKYFSLATVIVATFLTIGCSPDEGSIPSVSTNKISVTQTTASLTGEITSNGGNDVFQKGFVWDVNPSPTTELSTKALVDDNATGLYTVEANNLTASTTYFVRPFAVNSVGTAYGPELTFTTLAETTPSVNTHSTSNIKYTSVLVTGSISDPGSSPVVEKGVVYGIEAGPTVENNKVTDANGASSITVTLTGLSSNTKYYVRAYAKNKAGVSYSNEMSFTTLAHTLPTVQTVSASNLTVVSAKVAGNVTASGSAVVTERGIVYGTTPQPTITNSKLPGGSGTGNFSAELKTLSENTVYYARAYATSEGGTSYGTQITFRTCISALPESYSGDWYNLSGQMVYQVYYNNQIINQETGFSYLYDETSSIQQVAGGFDVVAARMGWSPILFNLRQAADKNAITIGSSTSAAKSLWKVVGRTLRRVTFGSGKATFTQVEETTTWIEKNDNDQQTSWTFTETSRNDWSVFITRNDGAKLRFDISTRIIYFSPTSSGTLTKLYDMTGFYEY
jgi:hypothetical protein